MTSPTPAVDPARTALVLIEYQNDFTTEGGTLHGAVAPVMDSTGMLKNSVDLVGKARDAGATIVHTPISFAPGYGEISSRPYGILAGVVDSNSFVQGSWGAQITEEMTPADGDIVIEGKRGLDAFASTNLDFILRSKGITTIALGGFLTNFLAATSIEEHDNAISKDYPMFSRPVTSTDFVAALTGDENLADSSRGY